MLENNIRDGQSVYGQRGLLPIHRKGSRSEKSSVEEEEEEKVIAEMRQEGRRSRRRLSPESNLRLEDASLEHCIRQGFRNCTWFPAVHGGVKMFREGKPGRQRWNGHQRPTLKGWANEE